MKSSKKYFLVSLISFLIVLVLFSGCAEYQNQINAPSESATDNISLNAPNESTSDNIVSYSAKEKSDENRIFFNYPQFNKTVTNSDKLNDLVVGFVKNALKISSDGFKGNLKDSPENWKWNEDEYTHLAMNINYRITRSDSNYFSVIFEGEYNHKLAAHPMSYFSSLIIDLKKCEVVSLSDLYAINMDFIEIYLANLKQQPAQGRFTASEEAWKEVTQSIEGDKLLASKFENADNGGVSSYLTEDGLGISMPLSHALGDHVETVIKYEEIEQYKKDGLNRWFLHP